MKKTALILLILTFLTKILGYLKVRAIAAAFGQGLMTDIYNSSMMIPGLVVGFITVGLTSSMIPILTEAEKEGRKQEFFEQLLSLIIVLASVSVVLLIVLAEPMAHLIVRKWSDVNIQWVAYYSQRMAILSGLQLITYAFVGYLQQSARFFIAGTFSFPMNLAIMAAAMMSPGHNLDILVFGTVVGFTIQLIWVIIPYGRMGNRFRFGFNLKDPLFKLLGFLILPTVVTSSVGQINGIINKILASGLSNGSISALTNSQLILGLFQGVFVSTVSVILFTKQAHLHANQQIRELFLVTKKNLSMMMMLLVPMTLGVMFLSVPAMDLLFRGGKYTREDAVLAGIVLLFYAPSMLSTAIIDMLSRLFYSMKKTKITMIVSILSVFSAIIFSIVLVKLMGVNGLALAATISGYVGAGLLILFVNKYFRTEKIKLFNISLIKYIIAGAAMMAGLLLLDKEFGLLALKSYQAIVVSGFIGIVIYFASLYALRTEELNEVLALVKGKLQGRRKRS